MIKYFKKTTTRITIPITYLLLTVSFFINRMKCHVSIALVQQDMRLESKYNKSRSVIKNGSISDETRRRRENWALLHEYQW